MLGYGVAQRATHRRADAHQSGHRTGQHHGATIALFDQRPHRDVDGVVHTGEVDVDHVLPGIRIGHRGDPGIGDHDVQPTEFGDALSQCGLQPGPVADIGLSGHNSRSGVLHEFDRGRKIVRGGQRVGNAGDLIAQVDRDDVGTLRGKLDRVRTALTAGCAGDEGDLPPQSALSNIHELRRAIGPWPDRRPGWAPES